jgi:hypothetical protein
VETDHTGKRISAGWGTAPDDWPIWTPEGVPWHHSGPMRVWRSTYAAQGDWEAHTVTWHCSAHDCRMRITIEGLTPL